MSAFSTFLGKERRETFRTWRLWILPGIMLGLALLSPVLTRLTPELLRATANSQPGVVIHVPPPTARDSYVQFMGNLDQLVIIAVIIGPNGARFVVIRERYPQPGAQSSRLTVTCTGNPASIRAAPAGPEPRCPRVGRGRSDTGPQGQER